MEMTNLDGGSDTMSFSIMVARGYSPPKAVLTVTPAKGHIFTSFQLDASASHDDEDSLNQLSFRWDFEGDGQWDTYFGDSVKIFHQYPETGLFTPNVQVRDLSGLIGSGRSQVVVTLDDPRLLVSFRCIPDSITTDTPTIMDASASTDLDYPDKPLFYRWDWNNDQVWDTKWLSDPQTIHVFEEEYFHFVRLQVRSFRDLVNDTVQMIRVYHRNREPRASFGVSTYSGNVNTQFRFDCWSTRDLESAPSEMFYRWDFDGDGTWDTGFVNSVITMHQYGSPGTFRTRLEIQDPQGGRDTCSRMMYISHGTNQTGIFEIAHGTYQYYGTVLIGDQWWFTRNLTTQDTTKYYKFPFTNNWPAYFDYGDLYGSEGVDHICPPGWRLPSREDWNKLFANYPEDQLFNALIAGGESDFGANLGGQGTDIYVPYAEFQGLEKYGYYWSATKPLDPASISRWAITFDKTHGKVLSGFYQMGQNLFSVRCMKDAN
jgi:uncharacterized protein (TIGR02145 family)